MERQGNPSKIESSLVYATIRDFDIWYNYFSSILHSYLFLYQVADKGHARAHGPVQHRTRQPLEGRARDGGLRIGEMEKDSFISHGATSTLLDRLLTHSDGYETVICKQCGFMGEPEAPPGTSHRSVLHRRPYCRYCQSHENVRHVKLPYAMKLLTQEFLACHIQLKFDIE